jgi:hypothetical protein
VATIEIVVGVLSSECDKYAQESITKISSFVAINHKDVVPV